MRHSWKRRKLENLAAGGDVAALIDALEPRQRDFVQDSADFYDLGWQRRADAARHLADATGHQVTAALTGALADVTAAVRIEALRSLVGRPDAADDVLVGQVLVWPEREVRATAEEVLREYAERVPTAASRMLDGYAAANGNAGDAELSDVWLRDVAALAGPADVREIVQRTAGLAVAAGQDVPRVGQVLALSPVEAVDALVPALADEGNRQRAIRLLGRLRQDTATPALTEMLEDTAPEVRRAAATALGEIKDPHAIDPLLRCTADDDFDVRDAALHALDGFGTAAIVWGLASVARGVLTSVTGDDWMRELEPGDPDRIPQLPMPTAEYVDADSDEITEARELESAPATPIADDEHAAAPRRSRRA